MRVKDDMNNGFFTNEFVSLYKETRSGGFESILTQRKRGGITILIFKL